MTELEIDQSHLPQVQKVCQCFAVLEDGALAHNLQEQEIEQYYTSNVQKNQLVQKDVRIARRLQDEEERAVLLSQASRQLEEQDFEYARMIQEEIRRCAEEARRREEEDEEMAKRIQEEEEMDVRRRKLESGCHGNTNGFPLNEAGKGDRSGRYTDLCPLDKIHSWTYSEGRATGGRHVRFQDEGRAFHSYHGDRRRVSLGSSHNGGPGDRCVVGSHGYHGDLAQGTGDLRVDHVQSDIERAAGQLMQSDKRWHSYRGNNGKYSQRGSCKEHGQMGGPGRDLVRHHEGLTNKGASHWANKDWDCNSRFPQTGNAGYHRDGVERKGGGCDSHRNQRQRGGGAAHANGNQGGGATRKVNRRVRGRASGRWRGSVEESSSEEEEEEVLQREERRKRGLRRNASVSKRAAGAELWQRGACLELGALQQVLLDEELARRLQEEEDQIHRKSPRSPISLHTSGTEADFRAAQVAQDEEIARYIQRQEVKTKRRSHDLEAQELRRNCGDTGNSCEMRLTRERKELDPTFKARRKNSCPAGLTSPGLCQAPLTPNRIFQDYMEEPMFIPPTKRNSEKSGRGKAKEKKEGCKQQ
ncbi:hypothetical protein JZ751_028301 [Albula glossodonta]|uniref:Coiled-coil domain-containing protein n=1 Tax=Albula glossodonta TaxID=121402 RepID=A0A8T2NCD9_9TELE|nr:hypothetical protein JZ751_028301 [Albula glossodonta]